MKNEDREQYNIRVVNRCCSLTPRSIVLVVNLSDCSWISLAESWKYEVWYVGTWCLSESWRFLSESWSCLSETRGCLSELIGCLSEPMQAKQEAVRNIFQGSFASHRLGQTTSQLEVKLGPWQTASRFGQPGIFQVTIMIRTDIRVTCQRNKLHVFETQQGLIKNNHSS
jgi:hypothetical protein